MRGLLTLALYAIALGPAGAQTLAYDGAALPDVIEDVERRTDWRFLYPDALVTGARVRLRADAASLPDALGRALARQGIGVEADARRRRILLVPTPRADPPRADPPRRPAPVAPERPARIVRGRVFDAETGQPLPFAVVTWDGGRRGVAADEGGAFVLTLRDGSAMPGTPLTASFVGYAAQTAAPRGHNVAFRLTPETVERAAVLVDALTFGAPVDTAWATRLRPGRYDAVGEGGGLRALDLLPSVAPQPLLSEGLRVRGSAADAFEVRLDGVPVYNPRHLFGLADAFNSDALRAVALHVGVAPAHVPVAPGGALDYVTAAGSPRRASASVGLSSLAARASASAPLRPGRTTALVGVRRSILGAVPSGNLVEQGLGVARRTEPVPAGAEEAIGRVVAVEGTRAEFWDLHAALADERPDGGRTVATAYRGGDATDLDALRWFRASEQDGRLVQRPVATRNRWGSTVLGLADRRPLSRRLVLTTTLGGTRYDARFARDDFTFQFLSDATSPLAQRVDTLGYTNDLHEVVAAQRLDAVLGGGLAAAGFRVHGYRQRYQETAASRDFLDDRAAARLDLHLGWAGRLGPLDLDAGARGHLFTGARPRLSPRLLVRAGRPGRAVSVGLGRSVQVLHRLTLGDVAGAAAWLLSYDDGTVTTADLAEVSVEVARGPVSAQVSAYAKRTDGLWLHVEDRAVRDLARFTVLSLPWLTGVEGRGSGVEGLVRLAVGPWSAGATGALAAADLRHPDLAGGEAFPAAWDRRRRATLAADGPLARGLRLAAAWTLASGVPNPLAAEPGEPQRLGALSRLDLRLEARRALGPAAVALAVAVRNALSHDTPLTREMTALVAEAPQRRIRLAGVPLDVYDASRLVTLDLSLRW